MDGSLSSSALTGGDEWVRLGLLLSLLQVLNVFGLSAPADFAASLLRLLSQIGWADPAVFVTLFGQDNLVTVRVNHDRVLFVT